MILTQQVLENFASKDQIVKNIKPNINIKTAMTVSPFC